MTEPVAVIDCGTNTMRMLVTDGREIRREQRIVRLGQGVDATRRFAAEAMQRALRVVDEYAHLAAVDQVSQIRFVATSAARDVDNADEFLSAVRQRLPHAQVDVISGDDEARYSFRGATAGKNHTEPVLVVDIGGGSTELIRNTSQQLDQVSVNIGAVRIRERVLQHDPPTSEEIAHARRWVDDELDAAAVDLTDIGTWIAVAGTVTTLAALDLQLRRYDRSRVNGHLMAAATVHELADTLLASSVAQIRRIEVMEPGRAEVIAAGALICSQIARRVNRPVLVSEADILDGIAAELLTSPQHR